MTPKTASTFDLIEQRLKELAEGSGDVQSLQVVPHKASGLSFRVGAMSRDDYEAWQNLRFMETKQHEESGGMREGAPLVRDRSDAYLLEKSVWSEDGTQITAKMANHLLKGKHFAPSTAILLSAAQKENPPREDLISEVAFLWAKGQSDLLLMRVLLDCGLGEMVINKFAASATPEQKQQAEDAIYRAKEALLGFEGFFEIDEASKALGITLKDAAARQLEEIDKLED